MVPFEIGSIFPIGKHIADFINLELFLNGYVVFIGGAAFSLNNRTYCFTGPSNIGKTTFLNKIIKLGGKIIADGLLIVDLKNSVVFPRYHMEYFGRESNRLLTKQINKNQVIYKPKKFDKLFFIKTSNHLEHLFSKKNFIDFFLFRSLSFLNNPFIRTYIFKENLTTLLFSYINKYINMGKKHSKISYQNIRNYDFEKLIRNEL